MPVVDDTYLEIGREFGFGAVVAVILLTFLTSMGIYVLRRLFHSERGILTKVGNRHVAFVDSTERVLRSLARATRRVLTSQERQAACCDQMRDLHIDPNSPFATVALRRAALHATHAIEKIAAACGADVVDDVVAMRDELSRSIEVKHDD
jgi:hypothetical protein